MAFEPDINGLLEDEDLCRLVDVRLRETGEWVNGEQWLELALEWGDCEDDSIEYPWYDEWRTAPELDGAYDEDGVMIETPGLVWVDGREVEILGGETELL